MDIESALRAAYRKGLDGAGEASDEDSVVTKILGSVEFRRFTIDDWIFDIKQVRALRVPEYGLPYSAGALITLNGTNAYIDSLISRQSNPINKKDFKSILEATKRLGASSLDYDRMTVNGKRSESVTV